MDRSDWESDALQFIAEGVTELAGFELAAISAVRGDQLETVAVAGSAEAVATLAGARTPVESVLAELEHAEQWGLFAFVPHERMGAHLDEWTYTPEFEADDGPDAWHPDDLLVALLHDGHGRLRGMLAIDLPASRLRPGPEQRRVLDVYARQAGRAIVIALEREEYLQRYQREHARLVRNQRLVATMAHELQNPIAAIQGHAELLADDPVLLEHAARSIHGVQRGAARLSTLTQELLALARMQHGQDAAATTVDLGALVTEVCGLLESDAGEHAPELDVTVPQEPVLVTGAPSELEGLLVNLVGNAVKYSPEHGRIEVLLLSDAEHGATVRVTDQGLGISDEDQEHLFDEFFRSTNPEAQRIPGTGLGLAIAKQVARRHGGSLDVSSELGRGSTFTFHLPPDRLAG
ncbi:hypothetical protein BH11ACT8_BH11ACT8_04440 [soil metagenome]